MAWKRVIYAAAFLGAVTAFVITDNAVALFLLVCLTVLPLGSFPMLLFARKRVKFDCELHASCIRGGVLRITMSMRVKPRFLVGGARLVAEIENSTFGTTEYKTFVFEDLSGAAHVYDYVSANSGRISVRVEKVRLVDIFGLCALGVKCRAFAESIVSPVLYDEMRARADGNKNDSRYGELVLPQKGGDVSEIFNIRDYAPGDSLNSVHWKLSAKFGALKSKEFGSTDENRTLILVDMSRNKSGVPASDERLNGVLDVAISISDSFKTSGYIHNVGWFVGDKFEYSEVRDSDTFVETVNKLMSVKVADGNADALFYLSRSPESAAFTKIISVSVAANADEMKECGYADVTAISVGDGAGEVNDRGVRIINVSCDAIAALTDCVL